MNIANDNKIAIEINRVIHQSSVRPSVKGLAAVCACAKSRDM